MSMHDPGTKSVPLQITEDEAAVYDRQIRLWGLEAQQRMRNATILVMGLKGVATEAIKNIVLAGIGKLIMVDDEDVSEEDLGAGFFFRDEDVGSKRVDVAKPRVESLNPLVTVEALSSTSALDDNALALVLRDVDMVCVTDVDRQTLIRVNTVCRSLGKPFYAGGTYGLLGYIFCDLLTHDYIAPTKEGGVGSKNTNIKKTATYCPLDVALRYRWSGLTRRQTRDVNPAAVFLIFALWEYQATHAGALPTDSSSTPELETISNTLLANAEVNKQALPAMPYDFIESASSSAAHELSPICAVVGGMLAQDVLKALAAREAPLANLFVFDGWAAGNGVVAKLGMS